MASPGQQIKQKKYAYGYNGDSGYSRLLKDAHSTLVNLMQAEKDVVGAEKLQMFLQKIKDTARMLNEQQEGFKGDTNKNVAARFAKFSDFEKKWYTDFVNSVVAKETNYRKKKGLSQLNKYTLLARRHSTQTDKKVFDDIAEEELSIIFTKVKEKWTGRSQSIEASAAGTSMAEIQGAADFTNIGKDLYNHFVDEFKNVATQYNQTYTLGDTIVKSTYAKADLHTGTLKIGSKTEFKDEILREIIPLLNNASFTVKNYKSSTFESFGLELGHTNLFRSIVAELNIVFPQNYTNWQRDIFYRGAQIMTKTNEPPSASAEEVMKHFYHMRFIYELSGLGLIDSATGKPQFVKYLIYNDPATSNIYVQDTASIILNEINKRKGNINTFGTIRLKNIKGYRKNEY